LLSYIWVKNTRRRISWAWKM